MNKPLDDNDTIEILTWAFHYQSLIYKWDLDFQSGEVTVARNGMQSLRRALSQIRPLQEWCVQHLEHDVRAAMMCSKLAGVGGKLLDREFSRLELIQWREAGLTGARKANLVEDQIGHLTYLSFAHFINSNEGTAIKMLDEVIELSRQQADQTGYAAALQHRGMFYARMGKEAEAIEALAEAIVINTELQNLRAIATCQSTLATCYSRLNEHEKAIDLYYEAIENEGQQSSIGTCLCNMCEDLVDLGRLQEASNCLDRARQIADETEDLTLQGLVLIQTGRLLIAEQDAETGGKVVACLQAALVRFRKKGERYHELQVLQMLEQVYNNILDDSEAPLTYDQQSAALRGLIETQYSLNRHSENIQTCNVLLILAEANSNFPDQLEAAISLGHSAVQLRDFEQAIEAHSKAISILSKIRVQDGAGANLKAEGELCLSLGQAYRHSNQSDDAIRCYEKGQQISETLHDREMKYRAVGNLGLVYADTARYEDSINRLTETFEYYDSQNDYRLSGHARFNLAYAYYRKGDLAEAKKRGAEALRFLTMINDPNIESVKNQMEEWV